MLELVKVARGAAGPEGSLKSVVLPSERRGIVRQRVRLSDGSEAAIFLERGSAMKPYDVLESEDGVQVQVLPEAEDVVVAAASDWLSFAKACYYLGNRHAPLQIAELSFAFLPDPVLEELCARLGLKVSHESRPFVPEAGAYAHHHHHDHEGEHHHGADEHHHDHHD